MRSFNIVIIGNGFDISHELPTKYEEFLKYAKEKNSNYSIQYNYFLEKVKLFGWIDLENEIAKLLTLSTEVEIEVPIVQSGEYIDSKYYPLYNFLTGASFIYKESSGNEKSKICISTEYIPEKFFTPYIVEGEEIYDFGFLKHSIAQRELNEFLITIRKDLIEYFSTIPKAKKKKFWSKELENINDGFVLNYNYTDTIASYVSLVDIINIHGNLDQPVFGTSSENLSNFPGFSKDIQKVKYTELPFNLHKKIKDFVSNNTHIIIKIIGHTLNKNDATFIRSLFDDLKWGPHPSLFKAEYHVYYYNENDLNSRLYNLKQILGSEEFERLNHENLIILKEIYFT